MRVVIFSDAHVLGPDDPTHAALARWIATVEADALVLGGDVFQHWWHFDDAPFPAYAPLVEALLARRLPLTVLPGNHDFAAPRFFARHGATVPGPDGWVRTSWDGRRVALHHGDLADDSAGYALATTLLRGRPFGALVDTLGPERGWRFLGRLTGHGKATPNPALVARQRACAVAALGGADLVVFGHTHAPSVEAVGGGTWANSGEWPRSWLVVEDGVPRLEGATGPPA